MRICILQTDIAWDSPQENRRSAEQLMSAAGDADMYVLPEMWNSGFMTGTTPPDHRESLIWMQQMAQQKEAAICGSMAVDVGGRWANRLFFVCPDGRTEHYDKRHLFGYGGEPQLYKGGKERIVVEYGGMRFLLAVCYDLRFPVWMRNLGDYDALLIVANWPESRKQVWTTLLKARALENQCYVIACNRTGDDPVAHYTGGSMIIDAKGHVLTADNGAEEAIVGEIHREELLKFRKKFPVLPDGDPFTILK